MLWNWYYPRYSPHQCKWVTDGSVLPFAAGHKVYVFAGVHRLVYVCTGVYVCRCMCVECIYMSVQVYVCTGVYMQLYVCMCVPSRIDIGVIPCRVKEQKRTTIMKLHILPRTRVRTTSTSTLNFIRLYQYQRQQKNVISSTYDLSPSVFCFHFGRKNWNWERKSLFWCSLKRQHACIQGSSVTSSHNTVVCTVHF